MPATRTELAELAAKRRLIRRASTFDQPREARHEAQVHARSLLDDRIGVDAETLEATLGLAFSKATDTLPQDETDHHPGDQDEDGGTANGPFTQQALRAGEVHAAVS